MPASPIAVSSLPAPVAPGHGALQPLTTDEVVLTDGFWATRQSTNRHHTLPHIKHWLEKEGWLRNFDLAALGELPSGRSGREFSDSEIYKYLEALAWELHREADADLERDFQETVARVAAAQEPDGYLNTRFGRPGQAPRWSDLEWGHELYCLGHLFQAAVARGRTAPDADDGLVAIAVRAADLVCEVFGAGGIESVCGHPEVETALVELARLTGERRYLEQARLFIERRGTGTLPPIEFGAAYFQDDQPIRQATVLRGHAVRANYLSSGAVDVAVETQDDDLLGALVQQWRNTAARRTYLTGGQGAHHQDEAFGEDFELPPDRAYSETCAGVASIQFSWRLLLARGGAGDAAGYADLIERTLFNVVATSPDEDGTAFYYANTLHQRTPGAPVSPDHPSSRASSSLRAPWFEVSCCPPNIARTLASLSGYVATKSADGVQLHQYASGTIRTRITEGEVALRVRTRYPDEGVVAVTVEQAPAGPWSLSLRVPAWASGATVEVRRPGEASPERPVDPGYATVEQTFAPGDEVILRLPMDVRTTRPDHRIDAVRGCVAVERGPLVLALESVDLPDTVQLEDAELVVARGLEDHDGDVHAHVRPRRSDTAPWPYASETSSSSDRPLEAASVRATATPSTGEATEHGDVVDVRLVPYHAWAQRGPSTMRVWIPATTEGEI